MPSYARFEAKLSEIARAEGTRALEALSTPQGAQIAINGQRLLNFCSNDYLGLANHPEIVSALQEGARRYGAGAGAAALLSGYSEAHDALAETLARVTGRDRAVVFSSGYMANLGLLSGLISRDETVISDELNHASLIDGVRLSRAKNVRYPHGDMHALATALEGALPERTWVVTDGVFSMDGDLARLPQLAALAARHRAMLICDDAHGFGVLAGGRGILAHFGLNQDDVPLLMVTFGKALGTMGAAVIGPAVLIDNIIQRSRPFIYDTASSPALAFATTAAIHLATTDDQRHRQLIKNIEYFRAAAHVTGLPLSGSHTPIQPLWVGEGGAALKIAAGLREKGLYVRAIRPPTVPLGTARLRICISAVHESRHLDQLVDALAQYRTQFQLGKADA